MIRAVVFDFDYTLGDSSTGIIECATHALRELGVPSAHPDKIRRTIGLSLRDTYRVLAGDGYREERTDDFIRLFVGRADQVMVDLTQIYQSVPGVFRYLKENGYRIGIVSTKFRFRIESILARDGLSDEVDLILGGEDVSRPKPDPEGLNKALESFDILPDECLYIGDSVVDAETARNAASLFMPVLTGVTETAEFEPFAKIGILGDLSALPKMLDDWRRIGALVG